MVDANLSQHAILGRLRLALANGRGLQAGAEDVIALAAALGHVTTRSRASAQRLEAAVANLPSVDRLRQYRVPPRTDCAMRGEHANALVELALAVLGEP